MTLKLIILFLVLSFGSIYSSSKTNYEIIDSLNKDFITTYEVNLKNQHIDSIQLTIDDPVGIAILKSRIINNLIQLKIQKIDNPYYNNLMISINNLNITYNEIDNADDNDANIQRNINYVLFYELNIKGKSSSLETKYSSIDSISFADIRIIENQYFPYTIGKKVFSEDSFFDSIMKPFLIIGSALLTGVLLFTVRS